MGLELGNPLASTFQNPEIAVVYHHTWLGYMLSFLKSDAEIVQGTRCLLGVGSRIQLKGKSNCIIGLTKPQPPGREFWSEYSSWELSHCCVDCSGWIFTPLPCSVPRSDMMSHPGNTAEENTRQYLYKPAFQVDGTWEQHSLSFFIRPCKDTDERGHPGLPQRVARAWRRVARAVEAGTKMKQLGAVCCPPSLKVSRRLSWVAQGKTHGGILNQVMSGKEGMDSMDVVSCGKG